MLLETQSRRAAIQRTLAFKAYEIEELADVYFFRPLGALCAYAARWLGVSPTQITIISALIGSAAGVLLYDLRFGLAAFALLVVYSILDSADGQLARMTGQASDFGRLLDGIAGYVTHVATYLGIGAGVVHDGGSPWIWIWVAVAGVSTIVHAQWYDYHRTSYVKIAVKGIVGVEIDDPERQWAAALLVFYHRVQRVLKGSHAAVESAVASRATVVSPGESPVVRDADRTHYRAMFYWPVRGWNLLGDNTRIYAIGVLAWIHHLEWFFAFVVLPMNLAVVVLWLFQSRADRRFLTGL